MSHVQEIKRKKQNLELRSKIIRSIREFFWSKKYLEVESPTVLKLPGQEPYLSPMKLFIHNQNGEQFAGYLHTSPEYTMKKMLTAGFDKIFFLGKCFRNLESFGGYHNPEFTMLEWYRTGVNFNEIMDEAEELVNFLNSKIKNKSIGEFQRLHMRDLWQEYVGVNLDDYLEDKKMLELCLEKGFKPELDESYEDLFFRIFLNIVEPELAKLGAVIIHHYPAQMAALAKISKEDPRYAERFELCIDGIELANAFSELTDADDQLKRLEKERILRKKLNKDVYDIDGDFIEAVEKMPECAGIALGVDRLVQILLGCQEINDVIGLPGSVLFKK